MATDTYIYQSKELRDLAWETEKARGTKGVTRFTEQVDGEMVYILAVPQSNKTTLKGRKRNNTETEIAENANLDLTDSAESSMVNEGGTDVH